MVVLYDSSLFYHLYSVDLFVSELWSLFMLCSILLALDIHRKPAITTERHGIHGLLEEKKLIYGWLLVLYQIYTTG